MKTRMTLPMALALVASCFVSLTQAQDNAGIVAVLDVAKVFDVNLDFQNKMKAIQSEAEQVKSQIENKQNAIRNDAAKLQEYEPGSPDFNRLEANLEQRQTALRTEARQAEQDLLNREARIYYDTYMKMQNVVASLAQEYGISLVLRFESEPIDPNSRPEVIQGVNRAVVYHHRLDLTKAVIERMGPRVAENPGASGTRAPRN